MGWRHSRKKAVVPMLNCPYKPTNIPCEIELDKMVLEEAERESMEYFRATQKELHCCHQRIQLLEVVLTSHGLPVPPMKIDWPIAPLTQGLCQNADFWQSLCTSDAVADSPGTVAGFVRQGGRKIPCRWQDANGICIMSVHSHPWRQRIVHSSINLLILAFHRIEISKDVVDIL